MFVSDTHLPQLLPPRAYYDRDWYESEMEHVLPSPQPGRDPRLSQRVRPSPRETHRLRPG
jgi:hypothetical protein